jgi:hypothetical protein
MVGWKPETGVLGILRPGTHGIRELERPEGRQTRCEPQCPATMNVSGGLLSRVLKEKRNVGPRHISPEDAGTDSRTHVAGAAGPVASPGTD